MPQRKFCSACNSSNTAKGNPDLGSHISCQVLHGKKHGFTNFGRPKLRTKCFGQGPMPNLFM